MKQVLDEIVNICNEKKIIKTLKKSGYFDISKDKELKKTDLVDISRAKVRIESDYVKTEKFNFRLTLLYGVEDLPTLNFIWFEVEKLNKKYGVFTPCKSYVFAKEV